MRKNFGAKAFSYPQPVFIIATYNEDGSADAMNAAWGGISDTTELSVCLSEGHKTVKNLLRTGAFTVSMGDAKHVAACDYVGIASGNNTRDKLAKAGFTVSKSESVDALSSTSWPSAWNARSRATPPRQASWWARSSTSAWTNPP